MNEWASLHIHVDKCEEVIFSPLSLWEKRGS